MSGYGGGGGGGTGGGPGTSKVNIRQRAKDWNKQIAIIEQAVGCSGKQVESKLEQQ